MCEEAHNYCLLGATNDQLAEFFGVSPSTIDNWIAGRRDFEAAVKSGRVVADAKVARGLYVRAVGYDRKVEREVILGGELKPVTSTVQLCRQRPGLHLLAAQPPPAETVARILDAPVSRTQPTIRRARSTTSPGWKHWPSGVERFRKRLKLCRAPAGIQRFVIQRFRSRRVSSKYRCPRCRSLYSSSDLIAFLGLRLRRAGRRQAMLLSLDCQTAARPSGRQAARAIRLTVSISMGALNGFSIRTSSLRSTGSWPRSLAVRNINGMPRALRA